MGKPFEVLLPDIGDFDDVDVAELLVSAGDRVEAEDSLLVLESDKASMETHEAVAYSLLARHYKRVSSHLANVATAVLGKVEDLDFRPSEGVRSQESGRTQATTVPPTLNPDS